MVSLRIQSLGTVRFAVKYDIADGRYRKFKIPKH